VRERAGSYNLSVSAQAPPPDAPPEWGAIAPRKPVSSSLRALGEVFETLLIFGVFFLGINLATARIRVDGSSMEPSLHDGELVVVNRLAYLWNAPARGDIVVFYFPLDPERRFIKRLIGLPGDTIEVHDGQVFVNGQLLYEPYIAASPQYSGRWTVGPTEFFVLGDNRNNSSDSQNWGMVPMEELIGKAFMVYWPAAQVGLIPHYGLTASAAP